MSRTTDVTEVVPADRRGVSRRTFLVGGLGGLTLAGCSATTTTAELGALLAGPGRADPEIALAYAAVPDEQFPIPAVDLRQVPPKFYRREVDDPTGERPGSIVVNTSERMLYHVHDDGTATRYGVGLGRAGFEWSGRAVVAWKRPWPTWTPPAEMIKREPELAEFRTGMAPGLDNPLGARALYIFQNGEDTLYRLHGTLEAHSIGKAVSSGCVRLLNQDVIHLYNRVTPKAPILVV